jgi:hypothetical protein
MGGDISHGSMVTKNYQGICDMILREIKCEGRKNRYSVCDWSLGLYVLVIINQLK